MAEEKKKDEEKEEKQFSPVLKFTFIGLACFIVILIVGSASINFGVEPTFEVIGGTVAVIFLALTVAEKFQDKIKFAKGSLLFIGICLFTNLFYLGTLWAGETVYNDESLWSPSIFALLVIGAVGWFVHWFKGSPYKESITTLSIFIGLMVCVLIAITLGGDEGARFAFVFVIAFEVIAMRLAIPSLKNAMSFRTSISNTFLYYLWIVLHGLIFFGFLVEAIALPIIMVTQWPLSNWQIVITCLSCPTAWYLLYAVWGKKYL